MELRSSISDARPDDAPEFAFLDSCDDVAWGEVLRLRPIVASYILANSSGH
ncbi:MAG: hypothetical protein MUO51_14580 [Woeseiaceae bacterium]|nr:hypothetical protein [Woeseiaceae bacterium]